ncbi:MAG: pentapeptide repeat-containing protein [Candidatus Omnitrophica bacterium]|nr:pentapeptide repeat-containing protein [Candidatus Omnitrophota bacterium]
MTNKCKHNSCRENAINLSEFCWKHTEDKNAYREALAQYIKTKNSVSGFYLKGVDLAGFDFIDTDCRSADFTTCSLIGANFSGADMRHCNLTHADSRNAYLDNADLSEANLLSCNLSGARLWHANMTKANLAEANLSGADLFCANLSLVKLWNADITGAKLLTKHNFGHKKGRIFFKYAIDEKGYISAEEGYRKLKQYFSCLGRYDDASWASFKERQMQRQQLLHKRNIAYIPSLFMALICGYGEKPVRVVLFSAAVIFTYAALYNITEAVVIPSRLMDTATIWDYLYFSVVTFTTLGFGDITPKPVPFLQLLTGTEAFLGAFMIGMFVFSLGKKYSAR